MTTRDSFMDPLRARVSATIADNALALGLGPVSGPAPSGPSPDGSYDIAMADWQKAIIKKGMHASGADAGFDRTLGRMTHGEFSPAELDQLKERSLDKLEFGEALRLGGVQEGPPVTFTPSQKAIVDRLMGKLGDDGLARRVRDAYGTAIHDGDVRVR